MLIFSKVDLAINNTNIIFFMGGMSKVFQLPGWCQFDYLIFHGVWWMMSGGWWPIVWFFKYLANNMVYTLGIYIYI